MLALFSTCMVLAHSFQAANAATSTIHREAYYPSAGNYPSDVPSPKKQGEVANLQIAWYSQPDCNGDFMGPEQTLYYGEPFAAWGSDRSGTVRSLRLTHYRVLAPGEQLDFSKSNPANVAQFNCVTYLGSLTSESRALDSNPSCYNITADDPISEASCARLIQT